MSFCSYLCVHLKAHKPLEYVLNDIYDSQTKLDLNNVYRPNFLPVLIVCAMYSLFSMSF